MANDVSNQAYRAKLAQAITGLALPPITTIMVGTGGVDGSGNPLSPSGTETGLYNQVLSKPAGTPTFISSTLVQYTITINPTDLPAGTPINEVGLKDSAGTLAEHSTFYSKQTDGSTTMTINAQMQF